MQNTSAKMQFKGFGVFLLIVSILQVNAIFDGVIIDILDTLGLGSDSVEENITAPDNSNIQSEKKFNQFQTVQFNFLFFQSPVEIAP